MNWLQRKLHRHKWEYSHSFTREGYAIHGIVCPQDGLVLESLYANVEKQKL